MNNHEIAKRIHDAMQGGLIAGIKWPLEKEPTHDHPDLIACYAAAWIAYLSSLLDCPDPITQACVDAKYADYEIAVNTCEKLHPPS